MANRTNHGQETAAAGDPRPAAANPAETYERYMVPPLFAPTADTLLAALAPRPGEALLDVGCGTGIVARRGARRVGAAGRVTGLDASADMLAVARAAAEREGVTVDWRLGAAETLPFADASFDLVTCQFALMFFTDRVAALREMRRALRPAGRIGIMVMQGMERHPLYQRLDAAIRRRLGGSPIADIFALGDEAALRRLLAEADLGAARITPATITARFPDPPAFLAGEIDVDTAAIPAMQGLTPPARAALVAALQAELADALGAVTVGDHVQIPFHVHLVTIAAPDRARAGPATADRRSCRPA